MPAATSLRLGVAAALCGALVCSRLLACKDEQPADAPSPRGSEPAVQPAPEPEPEPLTPAAPVPAAPIVISRFEAGDDEARALRKIRSLPAWRATIERYRFLARRGQSGAIHGLLIEDRGALRLVDETIGDGALSIPVALPEGLVATPPIRAVLWGAWKRDETSTWRWHATRAEELAKPEGEPIVVPPLTARVKKAPEDTVLASQVSRRGGAISFVIKKRSDRVGDGWQIADGPKEATVARLLLPGEEETYGDQSVLTDDERWTLQKNTRYWVSIRHVRSGRGGALPIYRARAAPYQDDDAPAPAPGPAE